MANKLESEYGMPNSSDILTAGRLIINGFHEKAAYEEAEDKMAQGVVPFYPGSIEGRHRRIIDGDICLTRKGIISYLGEVSHSAGYREDGYPGAEHATGFSLLNGQGRGVQPPTSPGGTGEPGDAWYQLVLQYKMAGVADQGAAFDARGYDDDVDITFQRRGLKTIRNNGPHTLHKGRKWMWEIPRSAEHARIILNTVPRQDDRPEDRITPYPREFDPLHDQINTYLMHKILVQKANPSRLGMQYGTVEPLHESIASFDKHMRMCFALKDYGDAVQDLGETEEENVKRMADSWDTGEDAQAVILRNYMIKYGIVTPNPRDASEVNIRAAGSAQWGFFKYLLYAGEEGERAMIAKLPSTATTMTGPKADLRRLQENSIVGMLGALADGNQYAISRIGGTIENDTEPGDNFDSVLESN